MDENNRDLGIIDICIKPIHTAYIVIENQEWNANEWIVTIACPNGEVKDEKIFEIAEKYASFLLSRDEFKNSKFDDETEKPLRNPLDHLHNTIWNYYVSHNKLTNAIQFSKQFILILNRIHNVKRIHKGIPLFNLGITLYASKRTKEAFHFISQALNDDIESAKVGGGTHKEGLAYKFLNLKEEYTNINLSLKLIHEKFDKFVKGYEKSYAKQNSNQIDFASFLSSTGDEQKKLLFINILQTLVDIDELLSFSITKENNTYLDLLMYEAIVEASIICEEVLKSKLPNISNEEKKTFSKARNKFVNEATNNFSNLKDNTKVNKITSANDDGEFEVNLKRILQNKDGENKDWTLTYSEQSLLLTNLVRNYQIHNIKTAYISKTKNADNLLERVIHTIIFLYHYQK